MDPISQQLMMGAAGSGNAKTYIEDVFSTWLYTGNGSTQTITNGIDLSGKGGLVWTKGRNNPGYPLRHTLVDTVRGLGSTVSLHTDGAEGQGGNLVPNDITAFTSSGYSLSTPGGYQNNSGNTYVSWTFRKAAKFFDVVTYTGTGSNQNISHNLGAIPGFVIVKRLNTTGNWSCWHRSLASSAYILLNTTGAAVNAGGSYVRSVTNTTYQVFGDFTDEGAAGSTYVAYLFAHDAGGFGDSGNDSVVSCGSYTGNGSTTGPTVSLGWEPQWLLIKPSSVSGNWLMYDTMRGISTGGDDARLWPNLSDAESAVTNDLSVTSTGFQITTSGTFHNQNGATYIYIAIRRGPMKTPTDATKVFTNNAYTGTGSAISLTTGFPIDLFLIRQRTQSVNTHWIPRLISSSYMQSSSTSSEIGATVLKFDSNTQASNVDVYFSSNGVTNIAHSFRRAPGFFDVVAYTGTGVARTVSHNLGVAPELMIVKRRNSSGQWRVYSATFGGTHLALLNDTTAFYASSGYWDNTDATSSVFTVGTQLDTNASGSTYIAYLFATCPGVSKVGSYTGSGTTKQIDCGFTAGARFVLIKRTDSTGDWYVWDTARGIVSGNDPYLLLNSTAAEVTNTDYIDPLNSGFEISSTAPAAINANGGSFIYLAIA